MSIQAVAWALEQDLPARPKLVLVSIANHADHTNGYCWLRAETIAGEAACSPRSVWRFIGGLVRNGYVRKAPRKSETGKQRANDYWIMFGREPTAWDWGAQLPDGDDIPDIDESVVDEIEAQDVVEPCASVTPLQPSAEPVDKHAVAHGPNANAGTRKESAEPSKTNPSKKEEARASPFAGPPRAYHPPPVEPMGAVADKQAKLIFVYISTRAWDAWCEFKLRTTGRKWDLTTNATIDGKRHTGWYFPSLFPPGLDPQKESTEVARSMHPP